MLSGGRSYLASRLLVPALLALYPVAALHGPRDGHAEFYPFFAWSLFPRSTDGMRNDAVILVNQIDGTPLDTPTLFYDLGANFAAARHKDVRLAKLLDMLVLAERRGDAERSAHLSKVIEDTFMPDVPRLKYDIALITYDPLLRYRTGKIESVSIIKSGEKTQ